MASKNSVEASAASPEVAEIVAKTLREADAKAADAMARDALELALFPKTPAAMLLPEELTRDQRFVAEAFANRPGLHIASYAIPASARTRRRWLGLDPPTVLERRRAFEANGETVDWPLWKIRRVLEDAGRGAELKTLLSDVEKIEVQAELVLGNPYNWRAETHPSAFPEAKSIDPVPVAWAAAYADRLAELFPTDPVVSTPERGGQQHAPTQGSLLALYLIARGGRTIEARWYPLLTFTRVADVLSAIVLAIPEADRDEVFAARCPQELLLTGILGGVQILELSYGPKLAAAVRKLMADAKGSGLKATEIKALEKRIVAVEPKKP